MANLRSAEGQSSPAHPAGFPALGPPDPPSLRLILLSTFTAVALPAAASVGTAALLVKWLPASVSARTAMSAGLGILAGLGVAAIGDALWRILLGGGPAQYLPLRSLLSGRATRRVEEALQNLRQAPKSSSQESLEALRSLSHALAQRDIYTRAHTGRVSRLARDVAERMNLDSDQCEAAHLAGLFHDIGKLEIPDSILFKPGPLDASELEIMRSHPSIGAALVSPYVNGVVVDGVLHHHERIDGAGYPDSLASLSLSLVSRIVTVCDTYDALISDRPYRAGLTKPEAFDELRRSINSQVDAEAVAAMIEVEEDKYSLLPLGGVLASMALWFLSRVRHAVHVSIGPAAATASAVTIVSALGMGIVDNGRHGTNSATPSARIPVQEVSAPVPSQIPIDATTESLGGFRARTRLAAGSLSTKTKPEEPPERRSPAPEPTCPIPDLPLVGCLTDLLPIN